MLTPRRRALCGQRAPGGKHSEFELPSGATGSLTSASTVKSPLPLGDPLTTHRPPVFVAAAAATVLGALYFVPNASANVEHTTTARTTATVQQNAATVEKQNQLADTGGADTTPYLIGGTAFFGMGAGLLVSVTRRARNA